MTTLGELTAQLGLDIKDFQKKVKQAERGMKDIEESARKSNKKASDSFDPIISKVKQLTLAYVSFKSVQKSASLLLGTGLDAARYKTLGVVLSNVGKNAGYLRSELDRNVKVLEKQGIAMARARQASIQMIQAHIDLTQSSKLARIAQDAAVIGNLNSSEAFEKLIYGIQTAQI